MRNISLSSRLQWAFRGTVLPGALATGDVDNDGCKEFVVGSVQGELAIFRGRGGCGSWRLSEDQIEPEYDCWDAVDRGDLPPECAPLDSEPDYARRHSTFHSSVQGPGSNRESLSVNDIFHLLESGDRAPSSHQGSGNSTEDEAAGSRRMSFANQWDLENAGHIKWEDALDIERDGRKPWIVAQKLGTISSVVIADICNCGHNSIVVVNGEGKCHIFDYPFKRRFHPDLNKRRRQHNHQRRFSQNRFFRDGIVTEARDQPEGILPVHANRSADKSYISGQSPSRDGCRIGAGNEADALDQAGDIAGSQKQSSSLRITSAVYDSPASAAKFGSGRRRGHSNSVSTPAIRNYGAALEPLAPDGSSNVSTAVAAAGGFVLPRMAASTAHLANAPANYDAPKSFISGPTGRSYVPSGARRSISGAGGQAPESDSQEVLLAHGSDAAPTSNVSSQRDNHLAILGKCEGREGGPNAPRNVKQPGETGRFPMRAGAHEGVGQDGCSADTGSSSGRRHQGVSDAGADVLSAAYGDADIDSDVDFADIMSEGGDTLLLTREEATDIENIWGANLGKKSGDWFPYVLDRPDMTFAIPTNVEHALVADIDSNGLNELVLTATDGFVYIFRIESTVKHTVNPTLTSLGMFSNIPTTLPSVNMTGNGSPYLYMSAPRSPNASDFDLDESQRHTKPPARSAADGMRVSEAQPGYAGNPAKLAATASDAAPDNPSDLDLVNQLLKSIKDVSATPADRRTESAAVSEVQVFPQLASTSEPETYPNLEARAASTQQDAARARRPPPSTAAQNASPLSARRRSNSRRISLSSRMRESFSGIVSGWDVSRRPGSSYNLTAPPSISHSQAPSTNNSGPSTKTHSRLPSVSDDAVDTCQPDCAPSDSAIDPAVASGGISHTFLQTYPELLTAASADLHRPQRLRQSSICIGALGILEEMPERRSSDIDTRDAKLCDITETSPKTPAASQTPAVTTCQDPSEIRELADPFAVRRISAGTSSRGHSRSGSLIKSIGASSRGHSRRGSTATAAAAAITKNRTTSLSSHGAECSGGPDQQQQHHPHHGGAATNSRLESRRESLSSNLSAREGSIFNAAGGVVVAGASNAAEPLEVAVSARGSFSKPGYAKPPRNTDADDDNSIASQVTERLAKLGLGTNEQPEARAEGPATGLLQMGRSFQQMNHAFDLLENDAGVHLPPPRSVVDWSATSADKIATWFLDNIPGNVSVVTAPASAFGTPLAQQRKAFDSDTESDCDCSSCDCSLYSSDSDGSSSLGVVAGAPLPLSTTGAAVKGGTHANPAPPTVYSTIAGASGVLATPSGINLPQPLGRSILPKDSMPHVDNPAHDDDTTNSGPPVLSGHPSDTKDPILPVNSTDRQHLDWLPGTEPAAVALKKPQRFLILSKPGGRFVPIDMQNGVMLPTVEPPQIPLAVMTGGNNDHLMNVDASRSAHSLQQVSSMGMSYPRYSGTDCPALSGSYAQQSPSWQSGSASWIHSSAPKVYSSSAEAMAKGPVAIPGEFSGKPQPARHHSAEAALAPSAGHSTEEPLISQFPSSEGLSHLDSSTALRTQIEPSSALLTASSKKSFASNGSGSVFNTGATSGSMSLSSNLRSLHRASIEGLRGQTSNLSQGPVPMHRGMSASGAITPTASGATPGMGQYDRRNLGFAGLRGYIGNGINRQRASGDLMTSRRTEDAAPPAGYFTPLSSGQLSARGHSIGLGQGGGGGVGSGVMPREPMVAHSSSMLTAPLPSTGAAERAAKARIDGVRKHGHGLRSSPSSAALPPHASGSLQRYQHAMRYSPSMAVWSSYRDGNVLSTINDQDDAHENVEQSREPTRRNSPAAVAGRFLSEPLPQAASSGISVAPAAAVVVATPAAREGTVGSLGEEPAGGGYWTGIEPPSARSQSSLGTSANMSHVLIEDEKEEEIEEAPLPMELDVATYMVGGVAAGKRMRRILPGLADRERDADDPDKGGGGSDSDCETELNELVSLVSMDGVISIFDPVRKVTHYVGLASHDPMLGIWKMKMHEEVCNPSPLETMLKDGNISVDPEFGSQLLSSTPAKRIYRRIGLSHHDLLHAARFSVFIEDRVMMVNQLAHHRRRAARRRVKRFRSQTRLHYDLPGAKAAHGTTKYEELSPGTSRYQTLARVAKYGLNGVRLRENLKHQRVGRAVRNLGSHVRDLVASGSTRPSEAESSTATGFLPMQPQPHAAADGDFASEQPSEFTTPGLSLSPSSRKLPATRQAQPPACRWTGARGDRILGSGDGGSDEAAAAACTGNDPSASAYATASSAERNPRISMPTPSYLSGHMNTKLMTKALRTDITTALTGWYGENKDDYRRGLRVSDHLVVSNWRGSTFFVDVGTTLDIAHYNELFTHRWNTRQVASAEAVVAAATASEKDGWSFSADLQSCAISTTYGHLSEFSDVAGLLSRLRPNASVIQFKFQDTVSAFLADTYAPATGGPNVPCMFYVDYKDRIWAYYHLDEVAEMDDVYGATWFRGEPESLHTPASKARALVSGVDTSSHDKPFSVVDLAHRRINMDPWMPLETEDTFKFLVSSGGSSYPYAAKHWSKQRSSKSDDVSAEDDSGPNTFHQRLADSNKNSSDANNDDDGAYSFDAAQTFDSSDMNTPRLVPQKNANVCGSFHESHLPGPYLCPIWADINSVDLYDVGVCNLIELATPELLVFKDVFCKDLGIDSSTINEKVNLASVPGLANWVRINLYNL
ncbi:hypothetical protein EV174_001437 [Coemansia sp. RSA 2320]|nr:hypothetical protein EV174_001437 [Coemansia sp. RSA 2320]